ncbi:hypothetical protein [Luteolibacter sp. AS25]|uniref:hypothetical protein n=1 Tax=Luteolibacter sp. AS25 TaxID=3135776 RepID=UPI00398B0853
MKFIPSLLLPFTLFLCSCQSPKEKTADTSTEKIAAEPTREAAISLLNRLADDLENGRDSDAVKHMGAYPGVSEAKMTGEMKGFLEKNEISSAGVTILAEKGKWGKLTEIFPERGPRLAEKWQLDPEDCWALGYEGAEAGFHWNGEKFLIIRCDDVGKLN